MSLSFQFEVTKYLVFELIQNSNSQSLRTYDLNLFLQKLQLAAYVLHGRDCNAEILSFDCILVKL